MARGPPVGHILCEMDIEIEIEIENIEIEQERLKEGRMKTAKQRHDAIVCTLLPRAMMTLPRLLRLLLML